MADETPTSMPNQNEAPTLAPLAPLYVGDAEPTRLQKFLGFFKSTFGKILLFTGLFLGISIYVLQTSNTLLFKGDIGFDNGDPQRLDGLTSTCVSGNDKVQLSWNGDILTSPDNDYHLQVMDQKNVIIKDENIKNYRELIDIGANRKYTWTVTRKIGTRESEPVSDTFTCSDLPTPDAPANPVFAGCFDNGAVTLRWDKVLWFPVNGQTPLTYNIKIGDKTDTMAQVYPDPDKANPAIYSGFTATPGQTYQWSVSASANGKTSAEVSGPPISCPAGGSQGSPPSSPPPPPTAPTEVCAAGGKTATLRWIAPTYSASLTYTVRVDNLKNGWALENSPLPINPGDTVAKNLPPMYDATIDPGQEYKWWVTAVNQQNQESTILNGTNFKCQSASALLGLLGGSSTSGTDIKLAKPNNAQILNLFQDGSPGTGTTPCGDNQYFVADGTDPTKGSCQPVPDYKGAAGQSVFICGLYQTFVDDASYKINDATKASLKTAIANKCLVSGQVPPQPKALCDAGQYSKTGDTTKCIAVPSILNLTGDTLKTTCDAIKVINSTPDAFKMDAATKSKIGSDANSTACNPSAPQTLCDTGKYLPTGKSLIPSECTATPSIANLTGDTLKTTCAQIKSLYDLGATKTKMNPQTIDDMLKVFNGDQCKIKEDKFATLCPAGKYPEGSAVPGSCKDLPNPNPKTAGELTSSCKVYSDILSAGKDKNMDTNTVSDVKGKVDGICKISFVNNTQGGQTAKVTQPKKQPEVMKTGDIANVTPVHPVAGKSAPKKTSSTGPEMWIYGIGMGLSYGITAIRKRKNRKNNHAKSNK